MCRFPLVHALNPTLIDDTFGVTRDTIIVLGTHRFQQLDTGDASSAGPIKNDPNFFDFLTGQMQCVDQARGADYGRSMLVIMKNGYVHNLFQALLNNEAFWRLNIFEVYATKTGAHQPNRVDKLFRIFCIQLNIDRIDVRKPFKQNGFALHHWLGR